MSNAPLNAQPLDVPENFGPFYVAVILDVFFYGIVVTQAYIYFTTYTQDRAWMKTLVALIVISETLNSCFDVISVYQPLVLHFGDYSAVLVTAWEFHADPGVTGIVASLVQGFFAWRVKVLTNNNLIVAIIGISSFIQLLGGIGTSIAVTRVAYIPDFPKFRSIAILWIAGAVIADVMITTTLVLYLHRHRTGIESTDTLINKLMRMTIQTGLLTSLWAISDLVVYLLVPSPAHLIFNFTLSKLYSISLLATLIARPAWQDESSTGTRGGRGSARDRASMRVDVLRSGANSVRLTPPQIFIDVEAHQFVDIDSTKRASRIGSDVDSKSEKDVTSTSTRTSDRRSSDAGVCAV